MLWWSLLCKIHDARCLKSPVRRVKEKSRQKIEPLISCEVISDLHVAQQHEGQWMLGLILCSADRSSCSWFQSGKCVFVFQHPAQVFEQKWQTSSNNNKKNGYGVNWLLKMIFAFEVVLKEVLRSATWVRAVAPVKMLHSKAFSNKGIEVYHDTHYAAEWFFSDCYMIIY